MNKTEFLYANNSIRAIAEKAVNGYLPTTFKLANSATYMPARWWESPELESITFTDGTTIVFEDVDRFVRVDAHGIEPVDTYDAANMYDDPNVTLYRTEQPKQPPLTPEQEAKIEAAMKQPPVDLEEVQRWEEQDRVESEAHALKKLYEKTEAALVGALSPMEQWARATGRDDSKKES